MSSQEDMLNNPPSPQSQLPSSTLPQENSTTYGSLHPTSATPVNISANFRQNNQSLHNINTQPMTSSLTYSAQTPGMFKYTFFYNPPNDLQIYHIVCDEMPVSFELVSHLLNNIDDNSLTHNYARSNSYVFYHEQRNAKKVYQVTCELASPQFLNKKFYNMECDRSNQQLQEFSPRHQKNLKSHLKQFLINYLPDDQIMSGSDQSYTFQNVGGNYI